MWFAGIQTMKVVRVRAETLAELAFYWARLVAANVNIVVFVATITDV